MKQENVARRKFIGLGVSALAGSLFIPGHAKAGDRIAADDNINHIGPKEGFTPQIGTLISMLDWISDSMIGATKNLTTAQLDHLHDADSNTIGSLMMHVAATEVIYQDLTFYNLSDYSPANKEKWGVAMELNAGAREKLKGNPHSYYVDAIRSARVKTKEEMKKRDDAWLLSGETKDWDWNNFCKWFHVTEHFANHRGQVTWYVKRLPK